MSEHEIETGIQELTLALLTAQVEYVNEHRGTDTATVLTAISVLIATTVDTLTQESDDPSEEEVMSIITEITARALKDRQSLRRLMDVVMRRVIGRSLIE